MAPSAEHQTLDFVNPYKNPYEDDIPSISTKLGQRWSKSSAEHSQNTEKDDWDIEDVHAETDGYAAGNDQAVTEQALPFQNATASDATRCLSFHNPGWHRKNLIVKDDGGQTVYYADVSRWTSVPDIVLHTGETKDHPIAAIARFRHSRHLKLGLGDPADELAMVWEEMKNMKKCAHSRYRLEFTNNNPGEPGGRKVIIFQRTRAKEDGVTCRLSCMNYRLEDEVTGEILGVYIATGLKSWKTKGTLHIRSRFLAGDAQVLAVLGLCGLIEKNWRRDAKNSQGRSAF